MLPPIPIQYVDYLATHGVFEGFTQDGSEPGYIVLWPVDEISQNNADVEIATFAPGYLAFATNGGGELLAFDLAGAVFMLPMIGMASENAMPIADSFQDLAAHFET
ncbi:SMI1/KNR4 family protein [Burkholderia sp. LMG 32019]|uniref:SMI1/KNR4 family protein n=1 Tax=Burkholderia sp. LMG 32019 TaxID=3158173 RepID=UPI003C3088A4